MAFFSECCRFFLSLFIFTCFGIFVGFEIEITEDQLVLDNKEFRIMIDNHINETVTKKIENIERYIKEFSLYGYNFYVYIMPFTDIDLSRTNILEGLIR